MANRTAADIFGRIFTELARDPSDDHKRLARTFAGWMASYGFDIEQTGALEALEKLGAIEWVAPDYDGDGWWSVVADEPAPRPPPAPPRCPVRSNCGWCALPEHHDGEHQYGRVVPL